MARLNYDQARADFEYLETLAELSDQVEIDAQRLDLMQNPTRERAAKMYASCIQLWMQEHQDTYVTNPNVRDIEDRY